MFCKTIILSNSENPSNNAPKGILTLSKENNQVSGKIRLYNLISLPQSTKIGLYINDKVITCTLNHKQNHYTFDLKENIDINQSIYCALIDTSNNKKVLLEGGSFNGFYFTDSPFDAVIEAKDEQLEQAIDKALKEDSVCESCNCANCEYKKHFYDNYMHEDNTIKDISPTNNSCETVFNPPIHTSVPKDIFHDRIQSDIVDKLKQEIIDGFDNSSYQLDGIYDNIINPCSLQDENINNKYLHSKITQSQQEVQNNTLVNNYKTQTETSTIQNPEKLEFLNEIIYQLDELFEQNPPDDVLTSIIPNSRFVKVVNESPYVLGVIYEDKMLKYIAYGVPANYNDLPPKDLGQHYQWLPLNPRDVMSDGYFMIFQDALNGTLVEINFEE